MSNSSRRNFLLFRALFDFPPCFPKAPAAPPRPGPPRLGPPRPAGAELGAPVLGAPGTPLGRDPGREAANPGREAPPGAEGPTGPPVRCGRAAKPGRTPPGPTRRPPGALGPPGLVVPGRVAGADGRDGGRGMPGVENGLFPGRTEPPLGRGETLLASVGEENGLFPGRGGRPD